MPLLKVLENYIINIKKGLKIMLDVGFLVWKLGSMPKDPHDLANICLRYGIKRLAFKLLDGVFPHNVPNGDRPTIEYLNVLRESGIIVEAWGYHYPENPGPQGDAIEERRQKFGFKTYHLNLEREWQKDYGMPAAVKLLLSKPKVNGFEMLLCSYRSPKDHPKFPFNAVMWHETIDGASPQVYWALAHNPVEQLNACLDAYAGWGKPVYPMGPTFGAKFQVRDEWIYWEPSVTELVSYYQECSRLNLGRVYYFSLDWVLNHKRFDFLEAATGGQSVIPPVVEPPVEPPVKDEFVVANCTWLNGRSEPTPTDDSNKVVTMKAGFKVRSLHEENNGWEHVALGPNEFWAHGDYLD